MPSPSTAIVDLRPDIGRAIEAFDVTADAAGYVGYQILRPFEAGRQAGPFGKIPLDQLLQNPETSRTSDGGYRRRGWTFTSDSYATVEHGLEDVVDARRAAVYKNYFDAEVFTATLLRADIMRAAEARVAAAIFNATTWTPTDVTNEWDDWANATPIINVETKVQAVYAASGLWPNTMVINRKVFRNLRQCDEIIERIAGLGAGAPTKASDITPALLAQVFDLSRVIVAGGSKNTKAEGETAVVGQIWSDEYCWIGRVAVTDMIEEPCIGRTFHWSEDGSTIGGTIESYEEQRSRGTVIRVRHDVHEKIINTACAGLIGNVTTI